MRGQQVLIAITVVVVIVVIVMIVIFHRNKRPDAQEVMKRHGVILAGTCRDVEAYLPRVLEHMEQCGKRFREFAVIIYENDSKDRTRRILLEHQQERPHYHYLLEDGVQEPRRAVRLAHGRNRILDKARELNETGRYDFLVMLDMDVVNYDGRFVQTIAHCFEDSSTPWDVLTANQEQRYYDMWALRKIPDLNYDFAQRPPKETERSMYLLRFDPHEPPFHLPVESAFGGIAIYRLSSLPSECRYRGDYENGAEKCEHVDFHECLRRHGRLLYIHKRFLNC
jgi:glycosyltransferase involved in cell wall biosynthesis